MGDEDFLDAIASDDEPVEVPNAEPETAKPEEPKAEPEPKPEDKPRDERGQFKEKEPETPPEPQAEPVATTPPPEPQQAPLTALLDERERRQKAEALAEQREAELQRFRAAQQPVEVPDPDRDPAGFARYQDARFQQALDNQAFNFSERLARKEHGAETVEAAKQWLQQRVAVDPIYLQQIKADADPYERLVTDYRRDQIFSQVSDPKEIEEFRAWKVAQGQLAQQNGAPAPPQTPAPPSIPQPSLASAPSAGDVTKPPAQSEEEIFAETFP